MQKLCPNSVEKPFLLDVWDPQLIVIVLTVGKRFQGRPRRFFKVSVPPATG